LLDRTQFHALGQAHAVEGNGPVYVTGLRGYSLDLPWGEENGCHEIDFADPETYFSPDDYNPMYRYGESIIVPMSGSWGVLVAEHYHAVVAGSREFVETLLRDVTLSPDEMALLLVRRWKELELPSPWLPSLLETIYGPEEAARLTAD
jgi:hypothetical protein